MRKIIVSEFMTLDGVMQAPGGVEEDTDGGFAHGGWTLPYWHDDIGAHLFETMSDADTLLLGRKTWQGHGGAFEPMPAGDPFGDVMNGFTKYVVSTTLESAGAWRNSHIIRDNVVESVRALKQQPGKNILIDGSSRLIHTLEEAGLIDAYHLLVYPLVLGGGKKVFAEGARRDLKLVTVTPFPTGVVLMVYEPA